VDYDLYNDIMFAFSILFLDYGSKRFGVKPEEVRKVMTSRINKIYKVEKAKEKTTQQ
jgi:hypothetical protein